MASIKKGKRGWDVRYSYYDDFHKRHFSKKSGFPTKSDAVIFVRRQEAKIKAGQNLTPSPISFVDYMKSWYQIYKEPTIAPATKHNYEYTIAQVTA